MPASQYAAAGTANQTITTSETVLVTTTVQAINQPEQPGLLIEGWAAFQGAASVTGVTLRLRSGSGTGGTQLVSIPYTLTTNTRSDEIRYLDAVTSGTAQYTLTAQAAGASCTALLSNLAISPVQTFL